MAGYQTIEALRPILHRGPVAVPVVGRNLIRRKPDAPKTWRKGVAVPPDVVREMIERRRKGESLNTIAKALRVHNTTVHRKTRHISPPPGGWPDGWKSGVRKKAIERKAFVERLRRSGFSYKEISDELGCDPTTVVRYFNPTRRGLPSAPISDEIKNVAVVTGFNRRDLRKVDGKSCRDESLAKARHIAFWLLRNFEMKLSFQAIAGSMGGFDHSSVMYGVERAQRVADAIGLKLGGRPRAAVRALWAADWREVGK